MSFEAILLCILGGFLVSVLVGVFVDRWLSWGAGEDEERVA